MPSCQPIGHDAGQQNDQQHGGGALHPKRGAAVAEMLWYLHLLRYGSSSRDLRRVPGVGLELDDLDFQTSNSAPAEWLNTRVKIRQAAAGSLRRSAPAPLQRQAVPFELVLHRLPSSFPTANVYPWPTLFWIGSYPRTDRSFLRSAEMWTRTALLKLFTLPSHRCSINSSALTTRP